MTNGEESSEKVKYHEKDFKELDVFKDFVF